MSKRSMCYVNSLFNMLCQNSNSSKHVKDPVTIYYKSKFCPVLDKSGQVILTAQSSVCIAESGLVLIVTDTQSSALH